MRGKEPKDEVQIYTWKDATLRELTDLVCSLSIYVPGVYLSMYICMCAFFCVGLGICVHILCVQEKACRCCCG